MAQEPTAQKPAPWSGTVRINPAPLALALATSVPALSLNWTGYVAGRLGVTAELDLALVESLGNHPGTGVLAGVEYIPVGGADKSGLFLDVKAGAMVFFAYYAHWTFAAKAHIGYQIVTQEGFVFTPAVGVAYNSLLGLFVDVMLDVGFAYRAGASGEAVR